MHIEQLRFVALLTIGRQSNVEFPFMLCVATMQDRLTQNVSLRRDGRGREWSYMLYV